MYGSGRIAKQFTLKTISYIPVIIWMEFANRSNDLLRSVAAKFHLIQDLSSLLNLLVGKGKYWHVIFLRLGDE